MVSPETLLSSGAPGVQIAIATEADVSDLAELRATWVGGGDAQADPTFRSEFAAWFAKEAQQRVFWIARVHGAPAGMVNMLLFDRMPAPGGSSGAWGYLGNMFIREHLRNAGLGGQLLQALLGFAEGAGLERVVLNPSNRSIPFYTRHGFSAEHPLLVRLPGGTGEPWVRTD